MMKILSDLFDVKSGNKLDLNKMNLLPRSDGGISFVGRANSHHGIRAIVAPVAGVEPYPSGLITVALGGTPPLASFVQMHQFYTSQNVSVLEPKKKMTFVEKVFACMCIRHNHFRYTSCGREANRTLRDLLIPERDDFPDWIKDKGVQPSVIAGQIQQFIAGVASALK